MSAVFNATGHLTTANHLVGATPSYPVLIGGYAKVANVTAPFYLGGVTDNAAIGSLDGLLFSSRGDVASDPIENTVFAGGASSVARQNGMTASAWRQCGAVWRSTTDRSAYLDATAGTAETTSRVVGGLSLGMMGGAVFNGGASTANLLNGRLAEFFFASGFTIGDLSTILTALNAGTRPINIPELSPYINAYQPLRTGLNDSGYVGPDWTNLNVTFDSADHPITYGTPAKANHYRRLRAA